MTTIKGRAVAYDQITAALAEPVQELVDVLYEMDVRGANTYRLNEELRAGVRALVAAILDTEAVDVLIPETAIRETEVTYRAAAEEII
ncbi:hypothetical protein SEA_UPYO_48 [Gordonia phage Upyo]|nr:hypothetical protein SEA_UPYO_48 [Gordonia phage Upyo]